MNLICLWPLSDQVMVFVVSLQQESPLLVIAVRIAVVFMQALSQDVGLSNNWYLREREASAGAGKLLSCS